MSSNVQTQINDLNAAVQALDSSLTQITGNTMSNYNQLSRIVAQQANIYNTVYYGTGNMSTGFLSVGANCNISGNLIISTGNIVSSGNLVLTQNANITGNISAIGVIFGVNKYINQMTALSGTTVSVSVPTFITKLRVCIYNLNTNNATPVPEFRLKRGVSYGTPAGSTWGNLGSSAVATNSASGFYLWNSTWSASRILSVLIDIEYIGTDSSGFPVYIIAFNGSTSNNIVGAGSWNAGSTSQLDTIEFYAGSAATFIGGFYTISYIC